MILSISGLKSHTFLVNLKYNIQGIVKLGKIYQNYGKFGVKLLSYNLIGA